MSTENTLSTHSQPFLDFLEAWLKNLAPLDLKDIAASQTAVVSIDLIRGFCTLGPLSSPRIQGIVPTVVELFEKLHTAGVEHFLLAQDTHSEEALEFDAFPAHCTAGSEESDTIPELATLPFADTFTIFEKNSLSLTLNTGFLAWQEKHPQINTFIVVGDCTDLCIYSAAMDLRMRANAHNIPDLRVIVPADCVQTYHLAVETAQQIGVLPHEGDLLHHVYLYHMALNGIEVVGHVQ